MVLVCISAIAIEQMPNADFPTRNQKYIFPFVNEYDSESSWANLTAKGRVKFPKNIWVRDANGNRLNLGGGVDGSNNNLPINAPFGNQPPILMRGDKITLKCGYGYYDSSGKKKIVTNEIPGKWVTKVTNRIPIEVEFEDNMYLLKQVQCPNQNWGSMTGEQIIASLLTLVNQVKGTNLVLNTQEGSATNLGNFRTQNETVCEVLTRLQKDYKLESFFDGDTLYFGLIAYYPNRATKHNFVFQKNIVSDQMNYCRTDDIKIGIKAYSVQKQELTTTDRLNRRRTKKVRLETFVGTSTANEGHVRTMYFWDVQTEAQLKAKATDALRRIYYEGYRGKFTTFGLPFVKQGDQVTISDQRLPERAGTYFVKSVKYYGGVRTGFRQDIEIDLRVDGVLTDEQLKLGV